MASMFRVVWRMGEMGGVGEMDGMGGVGGKGGKARQRYPSQQTLTTRRAWGFGILDR
jgi:hypothetical protein